MAIAQSRYVKITSGVAGATVVANRQLGGMFITENPLVPTNTILKFNDPDDVGDYFGFTSTEYLRAEFYFGWISKQIKQPQNMSFFFWPSVATGSLIFGNPETFALATFTSIASGDFTLAMGGYTSHVVGINCSGDASLAAVAATVQAAINAVSAGGTAWEDATVTYDSVRGCFDLASGATGNDVISITQGNVTDIAGPLGWLDGAILSNGSAVETIPANLASLINISNNFGSFAYIPVLNQAQIVSAAQWNLSTVPNNQFMYSVPVSAANAAALNEALAAIGGVTITLSPLANEFPEQGPMMIMDATDYTGVNSVQNYMYQIFDLTPSVVTDTDANIYDALRINYYGETQTAGNLIEFYQRGYMMGLPVNPQKQNVYANEIWFKDDIATGLLNLLLILSQIPADNSGVAIIRTQIQSSIQSALNNGTISIGKALTTQQKADISQITGDPNAWYQVQNVGYYLSVVIQPYQDSANVTEYEGIYTLAYSKDDTVDFIQGSNDLI